MGANRGVSGTAPSILFLRLPTTTHAEMDDALETLGADARVFRVVPDVLLEEDAAPNDEHTELGWEWEMDPNGGNWGLELIRAPQMWNLNRAVKKSIGAGGLPLATGVIDSGFEDTHEDLTYENLTPGNGGDHGTHIAGIIGATFGGAGFGPSIGVDGINPFANMVVMAQLAPAGGPTVFDQRASFGELFINDLIHLASTRSDIAVVNMSRAYAWHKAGIDTDVSQPAQNLAALQGGFLLILNDIVAQYRPPPIIVSSAGNSSNSGFGVQQAKYNSPMNYAALGFDPQVNLPNIIVVEAVSKALSDPGGATRRGSSNVNGHISAPGTNILSTIPGDDYGLMSGTSMAAPHVTGLIGYMLEVDPSLTLTEVRELLFWNGVAVAGGARARIDAWATIMDIDRVQGNDRILKMMVDIDDGTVDGNQRVDYDDNPGFPDYDEDDADEDGGLGDGEVDMSDFRVWRDWYLRTSGVEADHFDGREDHPKLDVNDNGVTEDGDGEAIYPRGDFNGDGLLSVKDSAFVPGAFQEKVSDLDVFKLVFDDPEIDADELDTLVLSSDVTVDASIAFDVYTNPPIRADIWRKGEGWSGLAQEFELTAEEPRKTFTVRSRPDGYWLEVRIGTESRFADNGWRVLATHPGTDLVMWPIKPIPVDDKSTFLNSCDDPGATTAQGIPLESLRVGPGDFVYLEAAGDTPRVYELVAVFSGSGQIKVETEEIPVGGGEPPLILTKRTITDAITVGADLSWGRPYASPPTQKCDGIVTDIPQDIHTLEGAFLKIPDGATHLFLGMACDFYGDNESGSNRVRTSKWYAPEFQEMGQPSSPVRKER